ncbi:MAG: hypothetical protein ABIR30_05580 [Chitinophagaceae bacterium]
MADNIQFRIDNIDVIEKRINRNKITTEGFFNFEVKTQSAVDESKELVVIFVSVGITKVDIPEILLADFLIGIGFKVLDFSTVFNKSENGKIVIPLDFENGLKTIAISTMRGIIFSNVAGTYLQGAVLPIIFAQTLKPAKGNLIDVDNVENV